MALTLLIAAALSANPPSLVLGKDAGADLVVHAASGAKVTLSASVGSVSDPVRDGDVFRARYTPPSVHAPSVALLLAQIDEGGDRELAWLSIPLAGSDTMEIETRPGSRVVADVAGRQIGPVQASQSGVAKLPMVVPPGVQKATLKITDKLGNTTEKPLDLDPPPFTRVRVAPRDESAGPNAPAEIEIFVVRPDGAPDDHANVEASTGLEVRKRIAPGVYLARWTAPAGMTSGTGKLEAKVNGQRVTAEVPVTPTGGARGSWWRSTLAMQEPWSVSVGALGGAGATYDGAAAGTVALEGAVRLESLPVELLVDFGFGFFSDVTQATASLSPSAQLVQAGVRFGHQLVHGLDGHATFLLGAQHQTISAGGTSTSEWTARYGLAIGANLRVGPGRALAQVQFDGAPSGVAGLDTGLGSVQLMVGYLVTVR